MRDSGKWELKVIDPRGVNWSHPLAKGLAIAYEVVGVKDFHCEWDRALRPDEIEELCKDPYTMFVWPPKPEILPWYRRIRRWLRGLLGYGFSFRWS